MQIYILSRWRHVNLSVFYHHVDHASRCLLGQVLVEREAGLVSLSLPAWTSDIAHGLREQEDATSNKGHRY